jgi:hypothetical protein
MVLVWDNLNVHKDRRLREFTDTQDWITCYFLPAYAPDLNPVEGVRSRLRRSRQANTAFTVPDHLMSALRHGLRQIQYGSNLINGSLAETGLTLTTPRQQSQNHQRSGETGRAAEGEPPAAGAGRSSSGLQLSSRRRPGDDGAPVHRGGEADGQQREALGSLSPPPVTATATSRDGSRSVTGARST